MVLGKLLNSGLRKGLRRSLRPPLPLRGSNIVSSFLRYINLFASSLRNLLCSRSHLLTGFGLTSKVLPRDVVALSGIYVDDFLTTGPPRVVHDFMTHLRKLWKTSSPQYLTLENELTFLGVTIKKLPDGLYLYQHHYTEDLLLEHGSHPPARKRTTSGEPDHSKNDSPLPPDPSIPEHYEWIKRGQRILGGVLWLSTRTCPDLAFAVSSTAQVLTKDLELLKVKLRHLLQYLNTTKTMGLLYPHPKNRRLLLCPFRQTLTIWLHNSFVLWPCPTHGSLAIPQRTKDSRIIC